MNLRRALAAAILSLFSSSMGMCGDDSPGASWATLPGPLPPLHPTAIFGMYKGQSCRVVAVSGNCGVVDNQGAMTRLSSSAAYEPVRAKAFLPGSITVKWEHSTSKQVVNVSKMGGQVVGRSLESEGTDFAAGIVASQAYSGCYVVLIFFDQGILDGSADTPAARFAFENIGDLPAGVEKKVTANFGYVDPKRRSVYQVLFFSRGSEIRSNQADEVGLLFRRTELLRHQKVLALYLQKNPQATLKAVPYLRFPPIFLDEGAPAGVPAGLRVDYTVQDDGTVGDVQLSSTVPAGVLTGIQRAVQGWLYFPRLENGRPQPTPVSIELDIQGPGAR